MTNTATSAASASESSSLYASSLQSTRQEHDQHQHGKSASNGRKSITPTSHDAAQRSKRDRCLDYLIDMEAHLRGQMMSLQSLSSHALHMEEILQDTQSPIALAARALDSSIVNMQHILRGNIALIDQVKSTWSESVPPITSSPAASAHEIGPPIHSETSSLISFSSDEDDASSHDSGCESTDQGNIPSPGQGPVETPSALEEPLQLHYHPDIADIQDFMIHAPLPLYPHQADPHLQSRRIILSNLPPSITPARVLQGLPPHGIIQRITILTIPPLCSQDTNSALLEFVHPRSAATCLQAVLSRPPFHSNTSGRTFRATARLIPTPSYPHSSLELSLLRRGWSRTWRVENVPRAATWYFLSEMVGLKNLVDVRGPACYGDDGLVLEFATIHEAARVGGLIRRGIIAFPLLGGFPLSFMVVADSSHKTRYHISNTEGVIKYMTPDFLERRWNRPPFNTYFPHETQAPKQQQDNLNPKPSQEPHLCNWTRYGLLAKQRREEAESSGAGRGREGAADIKRAPVPAVVREYLDTSTFKIINTTTEV